MFRDRLIRATHHVLITTIVVASMITLSAQAVVDPRFVEFNASPDHNTVTNGVALVSSYSLTIFPQGSSVPFDSVNIGKPAPNSSGVIRVDFLPLLNQLPTPGLMFEARVNALGPGGTTASGLSNQFSFSPACSPPSISPTSRNVTSAATTGNVALTATTGCAWTAVSNSTWITLTGVTSGMGSATVPYSIAANPNTTQRVGSLTIAGQVFTVTQAGVPCTFSIAPNAFSATAAGGSTTTNITGVTGCAWTATTNASWLTLVGATSGDGNGSVSFNIAPNSTASQRTGTLTIAGQTYSVTQAAAPCTYSISPASQSTSAAAATGSSSVTSPTGCAWSATSNAAWLTITGGASGSGNGSTTFSIAANPNVSQRTGTLTIAGQIYTVTQAAASCTYSISPSSQSTSAAAASGSSTVTAQAGCAWSATSNAAWITLSGATTGDGNGTASFNIAANPNASQRIGTLTIAGQTYTVTQAAAPCTYSISPSSQSVNAGTATGSAAVTTLAGCGWSATSNAAWITVTGGASGNGNGTASFSIAANPNATPRSGTLTIAGQTYTVSQAATGCTFALSPTSQGIGSAGGTGSTSVTAPNGCAWTAASSDSAWLTITGGASGNGNGSTSFSVAANPNASQRIATLTIGGQTFTVTQAAAPCTFQISPTSQTVGASTASGSTSVTAPDGCSWSAVSNAAWITVTGGASGNGDGLTTFDVAANPTASQRSGTLTIGGRTFTVTQSAATCTYSINPTNQSVGAAAATGSAAVSTLTGCAWTSTSNAGWITLTGGSSGSGNGSTTFNIAANPSATPRTGTITIAGQTYTVSQSAASCTFALSPVSRSVVAGGGTGSTSVSAPTGCAWTAASSDTSWLTITSGASGSGNGTVNFSATANPDPEARVGTLTIGGQTFTVNQAAANCTFSISPTSMTTNANGGTGSAAVTTTASCSWTAASNVSWVSITGGVNGTGSGPVALRVDRNDTGSQRTGTVTIAGRTFTVTQSASNCNFALNPTSRTMQPVGGSSTAFVTTTSSCTWVSTTSDSWITTNTEDAGSGWLTFTVTTNTTGSTRTGTIRVGTATLTVTQASTTMPNAPRNLRVVIATGGGN